MLSDEQIRLIQSRKVNMTQKDIRKFDESWDTAVARLKQSGRDLRKIKFTPAEK